MITYFEIKTKEIDSLIFKEIKSENENLFPIYDGIINIEKYCNAKFKILWILKEPYDDFDSNNNPLGGGWSLREVLDSKESIQQFRSGLSTYLPMIYTTWGILNNFSLWSDMDNVYRNPELLKSFQSIAFINVKKLPGNTSSPKIVIEEAYARHKNILLKQIDFYNPNIIIGGSTLYNFSDDLNIHQNEMTKFNSLNYLIKDNRIYIDAYHPAQRPNVTGISKEVYCDDIIKIVKNWHQNL